MSSRTAIASLAVVAAAAAVVLWVRPADDKPTDLPVSASPSAEGEVPKPPPPVLTYEAPPIVREPKAEEKERLLKLPTGEYVPALNGVLNPAAMQWPSTIPYSPIVGRERDSHGQDWYVHADGSKSTTTMVFRSDLGRMDPVTQVANPNATLPMEGTPDATGAPGPGGGDKK